MSKIPEDLQYTSEHEWIRSLGDGVIEVGITDFAQQSLGDVTFVDLPPEGESFGKGDTLGVVESVKTASDIYAPIAGEVVGVNPELEDAPEKINQEPYGAWMVRMKVSPDALSGLLSPEAYKELVASQED